jgi:hypothetical protein
LADAIEPTLRALVDLGYDRTAPYGEFVPAQSLPVTDTAALNRELGVAFQQGLTAVESEFSRSLATAPAAATVPEKTQAIARESLRSGQRSDSPKTRAESRALTGLRRGAATDVPNPKQRRPSQAG